MDCPKCHSDMETVEFGTDISVKRCTGCGGLYCKGETLHQIRDEWLADTVLDTGSAAVGAKHNEMRDIPCPGCATTMDTVEDEDQTHIILDICPACDGVFLDAGELTDIKNVTLMDHVRRLLTMLGR
jgi:Zn-finger nucleic acid-binding protein